jgi:hypothetical protein
VTDQVREEIKEQWAIEIQDLAVARNASVSQINGERTRRQDYVFLFPQGVGDGCAQRNILFNNENRWSRRDTAHSVPCPPFWGSVFVL